MTGCNVDYQIPECGSVEVESPNYPNNYRDLDSCQWLLSTESNNQLRLTIFAFDTEIEFDKVNIGNGANPSNALSKIAGPLSGSIEDLTQTTYVSNADEMWITFSTDNDKARSGFIMRIEDGGCTGKLICQ